MIISHKHKFIFIKSGKVAGSSLEMALRPHLGNDDVITPVAEDKDINVVDKISGARNYRNSSNYDEMVSRGNIGIFYEHAQAYEIKGQIPSSIWNSYYKFSIERDPREKSLSVYYHNKNGIKWPRYRNLINRFQSLLPNFINFPFPHPSLAKTISLSRWLEEDRKHAYARNWNRYTVNDEIIIDKVYSYSELDKLVKDLEDIIGSKLDLPRLKSGFRKKRHLTNKELNLLNRLLENKTYKKEYDLINRENANYLKGKNLIYIETAAQVEIFKKYYIKSDFQKNYQIIAIGPSAQSELIRIGIPFLNTNNFFKNEDHIAIMTKINEIISNVRDNFQLTDFVGVEHAYEREFSSFLRYYYLYCSSLIFILHNSIEYFKPKKIILPRSINPSDIIDHLKPNSSLIGLLGELYAKVKKFEYEYEGDVDKTYVRKQNKLTQKISNLFHKFMFNVQIFLYKFYSNNKNVIFATSSTYNIPRVMDYLKKKIKNPFSVGGTNLKGLSLFLSILLGKNGQFLRFPPPLRKNKLDEFLNNYNIAIQKVFKSVDENKDIYSIHGVSLKNLTVDYLNNGLKNKVKTAFFGSMAFQKIIRTKRPSFVFTNQAVGYHYAIGEQCKNENINAMIISHGTHVPHKEKLVQKEWNEHARFMIKTHFPLVSIQTPWTEKFLNNCIDNPSTPVLTGPLLYANGGNKDKVKLKESLFPNNFHKKIILHAATPFGWNSFQPFVSLTHDEYISHINDLIKSIEKMSDVFLAIRVRLKSFGWKDMSQDDIRRLFVESDCYELYFEGTFEDYLLASDLLVSFSSTTIEEALQVKIPVLQYDPFDRYSHIPAEILGIESKSKISPIYYVSQYKNLLWSLNWIKNNHLDIGSSELQINWNKHKIENTKDWISSIIKS